MESSALMSRPSPLLRPFTRPVRRASAWCLGALVFVALFAIPVSAFASEGASAELELSIGAAIVLGLVEGCLLYTSPSPRDA